MKTKKSDEQNRLLFDISKDIASIKNEIQLLRKKLEMRREQTANLLQQFHSSRKNYGNRRTSGN